MKKHGFRTSMIVSPLTIRWGRVLAVATLSLALSGMALAATDNDGCSSATLRGDYAFTVSGETVDSMGITFIHGVAMTNFDGAGNLTQVDFVTRNGALLPGPTDPTTGFRTSQTGTYKVNPDCTGSAEIHFPAPPGVSSGLVVKLMFVLSDHGRAIHTVVSGHILPGTTELLPDSGRSDGFKLGGSDRGGRTEAERGR